MIPAHLRILWVFTWREFREQYAGSWLGSGWALIQPVMTVFVYWFVFGVVWELRLPEPRDTGSTLPFIVFLLSALLPWLAFQDGLNKAAGAVLSRSEVVRHGAFPVAVFPVARTIVAHLVFIPLVLAFALVLHFLAGRPLGFAAWLALPLLLGVQFALAMGLGLLLAALSVYVRDVGFLLSMVLMMLFFTAPILYPLAQVPEAIRSWMWLNPFTPYAEGYHQILLEGRWPDPGIWLLAIPTAIAALWVGRWVFGQLRAGFADVL
ncbi:ABC transporter permease [Thioalkalivibrio paradoxus]|uniref:Transport permease protein n=1 Tax=Thioalkalivibrio paradoxus ARh 1 TaxID=713585 RepID=W0DT29_9GAMM|nr:ABC transporter permease [Thioalkalivibrio paradoxus]AHF00134.1 hypothetical protein THITH_10140 [Thioalkalivibrio paradoxus ARh 1]